MEGSSRDAAQALSREKVAAADDLATIAITEIEKQPVGIMKIARKIYASVADSDEAYRDFFKSSFAIVANLKIKSKELQKTYCNCITNGGRLAMDMVRVYETELRKRLLAEKEILAKQLTAKSEALTKTQA
ncbi:MAG: hypothetical protein Q9218_004677 [Villophora microphyllina]